MKKRFTILHSVPKGSWSLNIVRFITLDYTAHNRHLLLSRVRLYNLIKMANAR